MRVVLKKECSCKTSTYISTYPYPTYLHFYIYMYIYIYIKHTYIYILYIYIEQFWLTLAVSRIVFIRIMIVIYAIALLQVLRYLHDECLKVRGNTTFKKRFSKLDCKSCDS